MHFIFSDCKALKEFQWLSDNRGEGLGSGKILCEYAQNKIDVLCPIFHIPAFMWCSALKISLQAAVLTIFKSYRSGKLTLYCKWSISSLLALSLFAMRISKNAVNFRLEFFLGRTVMNKAVNPHLMTVSLRILKGGLCALWH